MKAWLFRLVDGLTRAQKRTILLLLDVALAPAALFVTCALLYNNPLPLAILGRVWVIIPLVALAAGIGSAALGIHRIRLNAFESIALLRLAVYAAIMTVAFAAIVSATDAPFPGAALFLFGMAFFLLAFLARMSLLHVTRWVLRLRHARCRVLIYGAGNTGIQLAAALRAHDTIVPVAFLDDDTAKQRVNAVGLHVYDPAEVAEIVRERDIKRVLLAMPSVAAPKLAQIARRLERMGLDVQTVPSFAQLIGEEQLVGNLAPVNPGQFLGRAPVDAALPEGHLAYVGRSVLVTGAGGSIGSELCRQLLLHRPRVIVLFEVSEIALYTVDKELRALSETMKDAPRIVPVLGSVTDSRMARMVMADHGIEVVFHAAAYKHVNLVEDNPIAGLANNVLGTRTLADAAHEAGVKRFILISTDKAVRPTNVMGASKRLAELVIQDMAKRSRSTVFSIVRFGNVLGSSGSVIPLFKEQIARGGPVTLTHEDVTRFFMTVQEASRLVLLAGSYSQPGGPGARLGGDVFVLDMGKPVRIRDLAVQMIEAAGCTVRTPENPEGDIEIVVTGLRPGEKLHEELLIGQGLLTTPHPKILRAEEESLSELEMASALRALRHAVAAGDAAAAREVVMRWVGGYARPAALAER
ncbi:MAG: polysaccharide biosynthesis protein [Rhodobacterales bacterium]|nr:polysaccharide biosynthesis protein [Rhodobacterales bacterium]